MRYEALLDDILLSLRHGSRRARSATAKLAGKLDGGKLKVDRFGGTKGSHDQAQIDQPRSLRSEMSRQPIDANAVRRLSSTRLDRDYARIDDIRVRGVRKQSKDLVW